MKLREAQQREAWKLLGWLTWAIVAMPFLNVAGRLVGRQQHELKSRRARQRQGWYLIAWVIGALVVLGSLYLVIEGTISSNVVGLAPWFGAAIGASLAYLLTRQQRREEDSQRRGALATLLLHELQLLEQALTDIRRELEPAGRKEVPPFQTMIYDQAGTTLLLFKSETIYALRSFYSQVYDLRKVLTEIRARPQVIQKATQDLYMRYIMVKEIGQTLRTQTADSDTGVTQLMDWNIPQTWSKMRARKKELHPANNFSDFYTDWTEHWHVHEQAISAATAIQPVAQQLTAEGGEWPVATPFLVKTWFIDWLFESPNSTEHSLPNWPAPAFKHSNLWAERARCMFCGHIIPAWHAKTGQVDNQMLFTHWAERHWGKEESNFKFEAIDDTGTKLTGPHGSEKAG